MQDDHVKKLSANNARNCQAEGLYPSLKSLSPTGAALLLCLDRCFEQGIVFQMQCNASAGGQKIFCMDVPLRNVIGPTEDSPKKSDAWAVLSGELFIPK